MKLKEILKTTLLTGSLLFWGCRFSSPSFDWNNYVIGFWNNGAYVGGFKKDCTYPAIYGINGWDPFKEPNIGEIIDPLISRIKVSDYAKIDFNHWPKIMDNIKKQHKSGCPVILLGHSGGCRDTVEVANVLEKAEVPVGLIFLDATHLKSDLFRPGVKGIPSSNLIPQNVYRMENYVTNGPYEGRNLTNADFKDNNSAGSKYKNIFLDTDHFELIGETHMDRYVESVNRLLKEYREREDNKKLE